MVGAAAMVGLGIIPPHEVAQAIDLDTIVLLLGMMLLAAYLTRAASTPRSSTRSSISA